MIVDVGVGAGVCVRVCVCESECVNLLRSSELPVQQLAKNCESHLQIGSCLYS